MCRQEKNRNNPSRKMRRAPIMNRRSPSPKRKVIPTVLNQTTPLIKDINVMVWVLTVNFLELKAGVRLIVEPGFAPKRTAPVPTKRIK